MFSRAQLRCMCICVCVTCDFSSSHVLLNDTAFQLPNIYIALDVIGDPRSYLQSIKRLHANTSLFYFIFLWHMVSNLMCSWGWPWTPGPSALLLPCLASATISGISLFSINDWSLTGSGNDGNSVIDPSLTLRGNFIIYIDKIRCVLLVKIEGETGQLHCAITLCTWRLDFHFDLAEYLTQYNAATWLLLLPGDSI